MFTPACYCSSDQLLLDAPLREKERERELKTHTALQLLQMCMTVFASSFLFLLFGHANTARWHDGSCTFIVESKECCYTLWIFFGLHFFGSLLWKDSIVSMYVWVCTISLSHNAHFFHFQWMETMENSEYEKIIKREMKCMRNKPIWHRVRDLGSFQFTCAFLLDFFCLSYIIFVIWRHNYTSYSFTLTFNLTEKFEEFFIHF